MPKLDKLIRELCSDGVKVFRLEEIAHYAKTRIDCKTINEDNYVGVENLLQNKAGKTKATSVPTTGMVIAYQKNDILIGNIRPYLRKVWLADCEGGTNGDVLTVQIEDTEKVIPQFLYYVLSSEKFFLYDIQNSKGAKMPRGSKDAVMKFEVPLPHLDVQREIVRMLDSYTESVVELQRQLTAELTARKTQYAYYRDKLLQYKMPTKEYEVGEICEVSAGGDVPKEHFSKEKSEQYKVPVISNGCGINAFYGYTDAARVDKPAVTVAARGTIGYAEYRDYPYFPIIRLITLIPRDDKQLNAKYLYYSLEGRHYKVPTSGIPQLTVPVIKKEKVSIPPLDVQNRIVNVLDNFEKICSDLNIGLPAEIEARQKQYEYYRDKLLTFAETGNTILSRAEQSRAEQSRAEQSRAERLSWLDVLKGIGIILVVIGHIYSNQTIFNWLYSFHMPLFFLSAGWVYKEKTVLADIKRRIQTIVIPYFSFGFLVLIYWQLIERRFRDSDMSFMDSLFGLFSGCYDNLEFNIHLWFLPCFFVTVIIFNILVNLGGRRMAYLVSALMRLAFIVVPMHGLIWGIDRVFKYIGFYAVGVFIAGKSVKAVRKKVEAGIVAIVLLALSFSLSCYHLTMGIMWFVTALIGVAAVILISQLINENRILQYFGRISLIILCIHGPVYRIVVKIVSILLNVSTDAVRESFLLAMVVVVITMAICSTAYEVVVRLAPWMVGKKKVKEN